MIFLAGWAGIQRPLDCRKFFQGLLFFGGDQSGGRDEPGHRGSPDRDPGILLGPFGWRNALAEPGLHLLPGVCQGQPGGLGLLGQVLGF